MINQEFNESKDDNFIKRFLKKRKRKNKKENNVFKKENFKDVKKW